MLSFGFNLVVLDPSDGRGNDTYCIFAIEDKNMRFISYCLSLSLYIGLEFEPSLASLARLARARFVNELARLDSLL